jgi:putative solute:sodium symporter small subunit
MSMSRIDSDQPVETQQLLSPEEFALRVKRLRLILLTIWGIVTFCVAFFARELNFMWLDRPFGFWMAAQGSVLMFLVITWTYALLVNRWEQQTQR